MSLAFLCYNPPVTSVKPEFNLSMKQRINKYEISKANSIQGVYKEYMFHYRN